MCTRGQKHTWMLCEPGTAKCAATQSRTSCAPFPIYFALNGENLTHLQGGGCSQGGIALLYGGNRTRLYREYRTNLYGGNLILTCKGGIPWT